MTITKYNGYLTDKMPQTFSTMLDRFFNETVNNRRQLADFTPNVDAFETENQYEFNVSLPGLSKEDISIDFQEGKLTIAGERKFNKEEENPNKKYHLLETQYGSFSRTFFLPDNVNPAQIDAHFENGILHVVVPKDEQKVKKHQIQIK
ncbi:Hsp20/alpha crystallin family protein [Adhaeribacter swui]|uniref:Hsp20/alpha crystallin family protein n=1 Tax=Adhaeribacter swui TaxID=2086471 RepID=A0A7G7G3M3_9BACT|nr:Hsp20/alpha crystallin family protein [Adhaeribacter swui]QNF31757.1 Hsp20/alpha crystallin family protein [Adhaeribacter swui]